MHIMSEEHCHIRCKIDVTKIDKNRLFKGAKGTYLDFTLLFKQTDYGDYMIVQDVGKEARESGVQGAILGNGKRLVRRVEQNAPQVTTQRPAAKPAQEPSYDDSIPF